MAITLDCACGRTLCVRDELAGRSVRCPACSRIVTVPAPPDDEAELIEDADLAEEGADAEIAGTASRKPALLAFGALASTLIVGVGWVFAGRQIGEYDNN